MSALPQVLKERVFAFKDSQGQLHIIFLVNRAVLANPETLCETMDWTLVV